MKLSRGYLLIITVAVHAVYLSTNNLTLVTVVHTSLASGAIYQDPVVGRLLTLITHLPIVTTLQHQAKLKSVIVVSRGAVRSAASSYAAMRTVAGSRPVLVIVWEWHIGLALLCGCSGALEYPTTNSCGPINKSLSLSLTFTQSGNVKIEIILEIWWNKIC